MASDRVAAKVPGLDCGGNPDVCAYVDCTCGNSDAVKPSAANVARLAVPKHIAPEHRHAYLGGAWCRRNGYAVTDNPYEDAFAAEAWRRGFVEAKNDA